MKQIMTRTFILLAGIALFAACNDDDNVVETGHDLGALQINVSMTGFTSGSPETRTTDAGYTTSFATGDSIGITVIQDGVIKEDNIPYKYNGTNWNPVAAPADIYTAGIVTYLVYYPYSAAMNGKTSEADIVAAFTPKTNQSAPADYAASDLLTGTGSLSGSTLTATLTHALALVEVSLPAGASAPTLKINGGGVLTPSTTTFRYIAAPATGATLSGSYTHSGKTFNWSKTGVNLEAGKYAQVNITKMLAGISVTTPPTRTAYGVNTTEVDDPTDLTGMVLTLTYSDGTTPTVTFPTTDPLFTGFTAYARTSTGNKTVTINYGTFTPTITLGVSNLVAKRRVGSGPSYTYTYHGYTGLNSAFNGETGQTSVITLYADKTIGIPGTFGEDLANTFTLNSGTHITLTGNNARSITDGGYIRTAATFRINSGASLEITGNITITGHVNRRISLPSTAGKGGAVYVDGGDFILSGGTISGNTATVNTGDVFGNGAGGGVWVGNGGTFVMSSGTISGNTASHTVIYGADGGGVYVASGGSFTMNGGTISSNNASSGANSYGGGVFVASGGVFTWNSGAAISSNTVAGGSGSVNLGTQVYKVDGGTVSGHSAGTANGSDEYWDTW
ncbi:beta strand repeat-containing protein [Viscerimonas tarda]